MCIIYSCYTEKPSPEALEVGWMFNNDGAGVAWFTPQGRVKYVKGLMKLSNLQEIVEALPLPCVIHVRNTSSGATCEDLTHPFVCEPNPRSHLEATPDKPILFHNGHWNDWKEVALYSFLNRKAKVSSDIWSDTKVAASLVHKSGQGILHFIPGKWVVMENGNKITLYGGPWLPGEENGYVQSSHAIKVKKKSRIGAYGLATLNGDIPVFDEKAPNKGEVYDPKWKAWDKEKGFIPDKELDVQFSLEDLQKKGVIESFFPEVPDK